MTNDATTVAELTATIRDVLQQTFTDVIVIGEISNYKHHSSGHRYFTLKDDEASISCVMWRTRNPSFAMEDGAQTIVFGKLSVYPPQGKYQIDVSAVRPAGAGSLQRILEERKRELAKMGYFDWQRKRPLPALPMVIGVVTSATGAALQDILSTIASRFPVAHVIVRPAQVQGQGAADDVADAINAFQQHNVDVLIVGRGGGSIEDLWAFNELVVAQAIFNSRIPVISAVGHETDETISDLVADVRAATPTHAAVLATPVRRDDMMAVVAELRSRSIDAMQRSLFDLQSTVAVFLDGAGARRIVERINARMQRIDDLVSRFEPALRRHIQMASQRVSDQRRRFPISMHHRISALKASVVHTTAICQALNPLSNLRRGFAIVEHDGVLLRPDQELVAGQRVTIRRAYDESLATIESTTPIHNSNQKVSS
jgi:exodeoxyribonuclease VII large subunit